MRTFVAAWLVALAVAQGAQASSPARLAWFYKPPTDGAPVEEIAARHTTAILTLGDESYRDSLRGAGFEGPLLHYVTLAKAQGPAGTAPGSACEEGFNPWRNQVAWSTDDFCSFLHPNETWFLHNSGGERLYVSSSHGAYYAMNPASDGWRAFFVSQLREAASPAGYGYDGIFLDEVWGLLHSTTKKMRNSDGTVLEFGSDEEWESTVMEFVTLVREEMAKLGLPVWANVAPQFAPGRFSPLLDGVMIENFAGDWGGKLMSQSALERNWNQVDEDTAAGRPVILVSQGRQEEVERATFSFAAYLMVAGERVSFRYHRADDYRSVWHYPEFDLPLGAALGPRYRVTASVWARDFEGGVALVNVSSSTTAIVDLNGVFSNVAGTQLGTVSLAPGRGAVLTATAPVSTPAAVAGAKKVGRVALRNNRRALRNRSVSSWGWRARPLFAVRGRVRLPAAASWEIGAAAEARRRVVVIYRRTARGWRAMGRVRTNDVGRFRYAKMIRGKPRRIVVKAVARYDGAVAKSRVARVRARR